MLLLVGIAVQHLVVTLNMPLHAFLLVSEYSKCKAMKQASKSSSGKLNHQKTGSWWPSLLRTLLRLYLACLLLILLLVCLDNRLQLLLLLRLPLLIFMVLHDQFAVGFPIPTSVLLKHLSLRLLIQICAPPCLLLNSKYRLVIKLNLFFHSHSHHFLQFLVVLFQVFDLRLLQVLLENLLGFEVEVI